MVDISELVDDKRPVIITALVMALVATVPPEVGIVDAGSYLLGIAGGAGVTMIFTALERNQMTEYLNDQVNEHLQHAHQSGVRVGMKVVKDKQLPEQVIEEMTRDVNVEIEAPEGGFEIEDIEEDYDDRMFQ